MSIRNIDDYFRNVSVNGKQGTKLVKQTALPGGVSSASSSTTISPLISRTNSREFDRSISNLKSFLNSVHLNHPNTNNAVGTPGASKDKSAQSIASLLSAEQRQPKVNPVLVILSGLPAAGKSTIAKYLLQDIFTNHNILGKIYNAGNVRRNYFKNHPEMDALRPNTNETGTYQFFNSNNPENKSLRESFAMIAFENCLNDLLPQKGTDGNENTYNQLKIGIFDATNSNKERRSCLIRRLNQYLINLNDSNNNSTKRRKSLSVIFLDVKCTDLNFWKFNIELKISSSPDYIADEGKHSNTIDLSEEKSPYSSEDTHQSRKLHGKKNNDDRKVEKLVKQLHINSPDVNIYTAHKEKLIDFIKRVILYLKFYEPITTSELKELSKEYLSVGERAVDSDFGYMGIDNSGEQFCFFNTDDIVNNNIIDLDNTNELRTPRNMLSMAIKEEAHVEADDNDEDNDILSFDATRKDASTPRISISNTSSIKRNIKYSNNIVVEWIFEFIKNYKMLHGEPYLKKASVFSKSINENNKNLGTAKDADTKVFKELLSKQGLSDDMLDKLNYHVRF